MLRTAGSFIVALALLAGCSSASAPTVSPSPSAAGSASAGASASAVDAPSGSASAGGSSSPSASASTSASASEAADSSASAAPSASGSAGAVAGDLGAQGRIVLQAITQLAAQTGVQASDLSLQTVEATEWSDGSLGCPDPATSYIQVITPGYKVVLTDGTRTYDIHASQQGNVVWCDNGTPRSLGGN